MPKDPSTEDRKPYGLRLDQALMREIKHLAVDHDRAINDLVEEALQDMLKKYKDRRKGGR
jgi:hypothetical protein